MYRRCGKRLFDLTATIPMLILLLPFMGIVALMVRLKLGRHILFHQQRPGFHGKPFSLFKFLSMTNERDAQGNFLPDSDRLTPFGHFLRSTSLDELPEFFNVIRGNMSLVGPRPLRMEYLKRYTTEQMRRHNVKPGITGWAQVNGRNALTWEEKFKYDIWYVEHQSFWLDLKIIILTIWKILKMKDINQPGQATMEEFMGTSNSELTK